MYLLWVVLKKIVTILKYFLVHQDISKYLMKKSVFWSSKFDLLNKVLMVKWSPETNSNVCVAAPIPIRNS